MTASECAAAIWRTRKNVGHAARNPIRTKGDALAVATFWGAGEGRDMIEALAEALWAIALQHGATQ